MAFGDTKISHASDWRNASDDSVGSRNAYLLTKRADWHLTRNYGIRAVVCAAVCSLLLATQEARAAPISASNTFGTWAYAAAGINGYGGNQQDVSDSNWSVASANITGRFEFGPTQSASAAAYANLSTGMLGAEAGGSYNCDLELICNYAVGISTAHLRDTLTFARIGAPTNLETRVGLTFQSVGSFTNPQPGTVTHDFQVGVFSGDFPNVAAFGTLGQSFNGYPGDVTSYSFDTQLGDVAARGTSLVTEPEHFVGRLDISFIGDLASIGLDVYLSVLGGLGSNANFFHTARIGIDLPSDVIMSSASGTFLSAMQQPPSTSVPEPSSFAVLAAGLGLFTIASAKRHMRKRSEV